MARRSENEGRREAEGSVMHPRDNLKAASELHRLGAVSADPHPSPCTALHHTLHGSRSHTAIPTQFS